MGSPNTSVVDAQWTNGNIKITGVGRGVTNIEFGTDSQATKDHFEIVVICYE